jgi:hypothetical protein
MHKNHPHKQSHKHHTVKHQESKFPWLVFLFTFLFGGYWVAAAMLNVKHYPTLGNAFGILFLPMLFCTVCLPVYLFVQLNKIKFKLQSIYWIPFIIMAITGVLILVLKQE